MTEPTIVEEGAIKKNINPPPTTERPPAPNAQTLPVTIGRDGFRDALAALVNFGGKELTAAAMQEMLLDAALALEGDAMRAKHYGVDPNRPAADITFAGLKAMGVTTHDFR